MTTIPSLDEATQALDTDVVMITHTNNNTEKITVANLHKDQAKKPASSAGGKYLKWDQTNQVIVPGDFENDAASAIRNLPKDAVLHYSFDEVPDYPDGTAALLRRKDFTSTDLSNWITVSGVTDTLENGSLKLTTTVATRSSVMGCDTVNFTESNLNGKIVKVKVTTSFEVNRLGFQMQTGSYPTYWFTKISQNGNTYVYCGVLPSDMTARCYILISCADTLAEGQYAQIDEIYVGNGSYTTPVIDNANGQNNGTNNGGIAAQGVSGKGAYFVYKNYARIGNYNLAQDFSISVWVKPDNATSSLIGAIVEKTNHIGIRNGESWSNNLLIYVYPNNTEKIITINGLLPANQWTNLIVTKNGTTLKVYKNGEVINTTTLSSSAYGTNNNNLDICSNRNTRPQIIDDFQIFNRALSQEEVTALYFNRANTPKYYDINDWKITPRILLNTVNLSGSGTIYDFLELCVAKGIITRGKVCAFEGMQIFDQNYVFTFTDKDNIDTGGAYIRFIGKYQTASSSNTTNTFCFTIITRTGVQYYYRDERPDYVHVSGWVTL